MKDSGTVASHASHLSFWGVSPHASRHAKLRPDNPRRFRHLHKDAQRIGYLPVRGHHRRPEPGTRRCGDRGERHVQAANRARHAERLLYLDGAGDETARPWHDLCCPGAAVSRGCIYRGHRYRKGRSARETRAAQVGEVQDHGDEPGRKARRGRYRDGYPALGMKLSEPVTRKTALNGGNYEISRSATSAKWSLG